MAGKTGHSGSAVTSSHTTLLKPLSSLTLPFIESLNQGYNQISLTLLVVVASHSRVELPRSKLGVSVLGHRSFCRPTHLFGLRSSLLSFPLSSPCLQALEWGSSKPTVAALEAPLASMTLLQSCRSRDRSRRRWGMTRMKAQARAGAGR
jgi:hypothetical protein